MLTVNGKMVFHCHKLAIILSRPDIIFPLHNMLIKLLHSHGYYNPSNLYRIALKLPFQILVALKFIKIQIDL